MSVLFSSSLTVLAVPREAAFLLLLHVCGHSLTTRANWLELFVFTLKTFFFFSPVWALIEHSDVKNWSFYTNLPLWVFEMLLQEAIFNMQMLFFQAVDQVQSVEVMMSCVWNCANQRCKIFCRGCKNVWWTLCRRLKYFLSLCRLFNSIMCC